MSGGQAPTDTAGQAALAANVNHWLGVMVAVFLVGAATGGVVFGWLGDRIGRVRAMTLSVLTYTIFHGTLRLRKLCHNLGIPPIHRIAWHGRGMVTRCGARHGIVAKPVSSVSSGLDRSRFECRLYGDRDGQPDAFKIIATAEHLLASLGASDEMVRFLISM